MTLNPQQLRAVTSNNANVYVVAGPGSGKTRVLVSAVKQRIDEGENPRDIAVITYTNAAAHEFSERLGVKLGYCGTLHGFCFRLIQQHGAEIGYRPGSVSILSEEDKEELLKAIALEFGYGGSLSELMCYEGSSPFVAAIRQRVWDEYRFRLRQNNLIDYDSILTEGLRLISKARFRRLFVDEAQDSADIDWAIYGAFPAQNKFIAGDSDQGIFSFRGANPQKLVEMAMREGCRELITLETNYRSDIDICVAANNLIRHNTNRIEKEIVPSSTELGQIHVNRYLNDMEELTMLIGQVQRWQAEGASVALLYRTNFLAIQARNFLMANCVNVQRDRTLDMPGDFRRAVTLVALCLSPTNDLLAEKYLRFNYTPAAIAKMKNVAEANEQTLSEVAISKLEFPKGLDELLKFLGVNEVSQMTVGLIRQRMALLPEDAGLSDLLSDLYAHQDWNRAADEQDDVGCYVGTMHSAKGKEFDVVFLPAFEDGTIPHPISTDDDQPSMEEERRLAFVAITRARHQLFISHAGIRKPKWGAPAAREPSRFIAEMEL